MACQRNGKIHASIVRVSSTFKSFHAVRNILFKRTFSLDQTLPLVEEKTDLYEGKEEENYSFQLDSTPIMSVLWIAVQALAAIHPQFSQTDQGCFIR